MSVTSVNPDSGALSTTLDVSVNGNGFSNGMAAVWQFAGVADPSQIKTNSTRYVSAKQLVANITISGTATSGQWDVALFAGGKTGVGSEVGVLKNGFKVTDPTTTWTYPLNDAGLGVRSDHLYSDGVHSVYSNGVCNLSTTIFATDAKSNSGDATLEHRSQRPVRPSFHVRVSRRLQRDAAQFQQSAHAREHHVLDPDRHDGRAAAPHGVGCRSRTSPRDAAVWSGAAGVLAQTAAGSDSVLVTRLDASTWHVVSQPPPHNLAWCKTTGELFAMPVDFTVVSNRPLP